MLSRAPAVCMLLTAAATGAVKLGTVRQIGGSNVDSVAGMVRDAAGNLYIAGKTYSLDFPANVNQTRPGGDNLWRIEDGGAKLTALYGHGGAAVLAVAAVPGQLFVLTARGLLKSADNGDTFLAAGATLPAEPNFGGVAIDGNNVYVALSASGVFKSTDGGVTFHPSGAGLAATPQGLYPEQIYVDPSRHTTLFAASRFIAAGLYRSDDAGATWQRQPLYVWNLMFDRAHPGVIYGDGIDQTYVSSDDGANWTANAPTSAGLGAGGAMPLAVDSQGNLFATDLSTLYLSRDRGVSWTQVHTFGNTRLLAADPDSSAVYLLAGETLYASTDGFATYQTVETYRIANISMLAISRGVVFAGTQNLTSDAFVAKLDPGGNLIWATYLGGPYDEYATAVTVDGNGDVFVCGYSSIPPAFGGSFVARLSNGGRLLYSKTFTDIYTIAQGIAVDAAGDAFVTGITQASIGGVIGSLPVTSGAAQQTLLPPSGKAPEPLLPVIAARDAFACKLAPDGTLVYCTYLGAGNNAGTTIAIDGDGNAYVAGGGSLWTLNPAGSAILYTQSLTGAAILTGALDGRGSWFVGGTVSVPQFPVTPGAFQRTLDSGTPLPISGNLNANTQGDGFVTRLDQQTGAIVASTLLGGEAADAVEALALGADGSVTVAGMTMSRTFPLRGAVQAAFAAHTGFVTRLTGDLSTLVFSTYAGDTRNFAVFGVTLADDGSVLFAGDTAYPWGTGPLAGGAVPPASIFVAQLIPEVSSTPELAAVLNAASRQGTRIAPNQIVTVLVRGAGADAAVWVDGAPLPVISASPGVIVAQIPADYQALPAVNLQVKAGDAVSSPLLLPGAIAAPAIYAQDGSGQGLGLIFNEDGSLNGAANPAAPGSVISVACNGIGPSTPVSVYIDGSLAKLVDAQVQSLAGLPGAATILRVRIPTQDETHYKMLPLVAVMLNVGGVSNVSGILSPPGVAVAIQQ